MIYEDMARCKIWIQFGSDPLWYWLSIALVNGSLPGATLFSDPAIDPTALLSEWPSIESHSQITNFEAFIKHSLRKAFNMRRHLSAKHRHHRRTTMMFLQSNSMCLRAELLCLNCESFENGYFYCAFDFCIFHLFTIPWNLLFFTNNWNRLFFFRNIFSIKCYIKWHVTSSKRQQMLNGYWFLRFWTEHFQFGSTIMWPYPVQSSLQHNRTLTDGRQKEQNRPGWQWQSEWLWKRHHIHVNTD